MENNRGLSAPHRKRDCKLILLAMAVVIMTVSGCVEKLSETRQKPLNPGETFTHKSGFVFPQQIGGFDRERAYQYASDDVDVSVGYNHYAENIALTVYIYPVPAVPPDNTFDGHFANYSYVILDNQGGGEQVSVEDVTVFENEGRHAVFSYTTRHAGRNQPVLSEFWLFTHGGHFVKFRMTYAVENKEEAERQIQAFMESLRWPGAGQE